MDYAPGWTNHMLILVLFLSSLHSLRRMISFGAAVLPETTVFTYLA